MSNLAKEYRKQFVATPGHWIVELDYKALEAQLVGFYAKDPDYVRASKLGVHTILLSHVVEKPIDLQLPGKELAPLLRALKASEGTLYDACKRVVHMSNYGGSAKRIRLEYPEYFDSVAAAKRIQDIYFNTIARKVKRWQQLTLTQANDLGYLENAYGYRHYFYDALRYSSKSMGSLVWGNDAKRALAFLPQSTGAGLLSEALLLISKNPEVFACLRWIIHDSIVAEIPDKKLYEYVMFIKKCMETPQAVLGGLSVEVEVEYGRNWGELKEYYVMEAK